MKFHSKLIKIILSGFLITGIYACNGETKKSSNSDEKPPSRILDYEKELDFLDADGNTISTIQIAVADDDGERNQGLMDVRSLPQDSGMLFEFPDEQPRSFWMANTPLPLDILYISADSTIVRIYQQTKPYSQESLPSGSAAKFVVEVNGGYTINNDIQEGYKVRIN